MRDLREGLVQVIEQRPDYRRRTRGYAQVQIGVQVHPAEGRLFRRIDDRSRHVEQPAPRDTAPAEHVVEPRFHAVAGHAN